MRKMAKILQVAFTYMGTIVGAGFATGKEILQFFTQYGYLATWTIGAACLLFVWLGIKLMLLANEIGASSYEDLNKELFGEQAGRWISLFTLVMLFGVSSVMLAGAGSLFKEHLGYSYQIGLLLTLGITFIALYKGMSTILAVNSVVVPIMLLFTAAIVWSTTRSPDAGNWLVLEGTAPWHRVLFAPVLYAAYNMAMAQAVLVPLGSTIKDRSTLYWGGLLGGLGIGAMLICCHYALSARMPGIVQFDIPMAQLISPLGRTVQLLYLAVIFGEILTTFLSNVYGLALQLRQRTRLGMQLLISLVLAGCYAISLIGFSRLLEVLYPLFGVICLAWFVLMMWRSQSRLGKA